MDFGPRCVWVSHEPENIKLQDEPFTMRIRPSELAGRTPMPKSGLEMARINSRGHLLASCGGTEEQPERLDRMNRIHRMGDREGGGDSFMKATFFRSQGWTTR